MLFIAILLTFGRLYAESEITVMRACGVGQRILVRVALILSLFTAGLAAYNALWLSPWAIQKQAAIVEDAKANPTMGGIGFWSIHVHKQQLISSYSLIRLTVIKSVMFIFSK